MINPYALSLINLILVLAFGFCLFIYNYILKKKINLLYLLILISLLPVWSIFRPGVYESGDLWIHITNAIAFYKSLTEGILIPRWAGELNATFGFPAFIFIYSLPYYIISFFHSVGISFVLSTKLLLAFSYIASGIAMFTWIKEELNEKAGFIASIFYLFAPYHLVDLHFRADVGEILAFVILPVNLYLIKKFVESTSIKYFLLLALSFALLVISHPAISLASPPLLVAYLWFCWYRRKKHHIKKLVLGLISLALGMMLTAYSWLPTIFLLKYTQQSTISSITFPNFFEFIYSPWRLGLLFQGPKGELSYIIGYMQVIFVIIAFYLLLKNILNFKDKPLIKLFLLFFLGYFFMMQSLSAPLWEIIPFIKHFQFVYRLLLIISLTTSVLAATILYGLKNKLLLILIFLVTIGSTILNWGNRQVISQINDTYLIKQLPLSTADGAGLGQAAPVWTDPNNTWESKIPKNHLEVIKGQTDVKQLLRTTNFHEYALSVSKTSLLRENTLYFPGWNLYLNGKNYPISITKASPKGVIEFTVKPGLYDVQLRFEDLPIVIFSNILSLAGLFIIMLMLSKNYIYLHLLSFLKPKDHP